MNACLALGAHVSLPKGTTCGVWEWVECPDCEAYYLGDVHGDCAECGSTWGNINNQESERTGQ